MAVLQQMLIFLCLMLVGIYARRKGMLTEKNQQQISAITINIAYPAIILSGVGNGEKPMSGNELLVSFGTAIFVLVAMVIIGKILPRVLGYDKKLFGIVNVMTVFTNIGFMGVPMIDGIYGKGALIYMTVFLIPFNILFYSYAIQTIQPDTSARKRFNLKDLCNIGMLSCLLAIVIYFSGIKIPYVLATTIHMIGALTAPLAMMLIGSSLPDINFRELFTDRRLILFTALKMVIFPAAILIVMKPFIQNEILLAVCMAAMATPSGNMLAMLAALYNKDAFLTATKGISLTTAAAVITMPLVALLAGIGH